MAIEIRPFGESQLYAEAGKIIGESERAKEERARAEREAERQQQINAQTVARQWELQKMLLNSQQDFAHEQRIRQAQLNAEARAHEWEVEKAEISSRMDFEQEEKKRQQEYNEFLNTDKYIKDKITSGELAPDKGEDLYFLNAYRHADLDKPEIIERLGRSSEYIQRLKTGRASTQSIFNLEPTTMGVDNPLGLDIQATPVSQLPQEVLKLEQGNKFEVISPDGKSEIIDAIKWPEYKAKGFILGAIRKQRQRAEISRNIKETPLSFETLGSYGGF